MSTEYFVLFLEESVSEPITSTFKTVYEISKNLVWVNSLAYAYVLDSLNRLDCKLVNLAITNSVDSMMKTLDGVSLNCVVFRCLGDTVEEMQLIAALNKKLEDLKDNQSKIEIGFRPKNPEPVIYVDSCSSWCTGQRRRTLMPIDFETDKIKPWDRESVKKNQPWYRKFADR